VLEALIAEWQHHPPLDHIKEHVLLYYRLLKNNEPHQQELLLALPQYLSHMSENAVSALLHYLYSHDMLEEELILQWAEPPTATQPFLHWLRTAEEEQ
jgi:trans-aconitate methyltransferase